MNILILSSGTRNKLVSYFLKEFKNEGKIICADCNPLAPTLYDADKHYIVPRIDYPSYIDIVLDICEKENINGVFSLIDPELSLLAKNKKKFEEKGIFVFVSDYSQVEMSFDKYLFYRFCKDNYFPTVQSYVDINEFKTDLKDDKIHFPVFIKPKDGSCSVNIQKIDNMKDLEFNYNKYPGLIIQQYMDGEEYGLDVYIDTISKEVISIFIKQKILMRAGETDKSVSVKDQKLFELVQQFVLKAGFVGQIDIDIFKVNNNYYLSEVNPRFGGGYPHAYECGCNFPKYMLNNLKNIINTPDIGNYKDGIYMMKYLDLKIVENGEINHD